METEEWAFISQTMGTAALHNSQPFFPQVLSLVWLGLLTPLTSCLQKAIWAPLWSFFFGFKHQKAEAWEGNGYALAHFYYQNYVWTHGCACLHGSVAACRFHLVAKRLYSISKTHGNTIKCVTSFICFHMLSVTPASTPCLMDFQMQVDDFFQDLTGIFLLCSQMEIRHEWFFWRWGKILHTEYKHFPWSCLKRPNVMLHAHFHILPNKRE